MSITVYYLLIFSITFLISVIITLGVRYLALKFNIIDTPQKPRKLHARIVPLMGGSAIFLSFFIMLYAVRAQLVSGNLEYHHWLGFFLGGIFLMLGGWLDDKYNLKPSVQILFPILASLSVVLGGVSIEKITNPFGGFIYFNSWQVSIPFASIAGYSLSVWSGVLIFIWLIGMMYTTKLLDGVDGLVSGLSAVGALIIFLFTISTRYFQPDIGLAALILAGASAGFLIFNWHPARIFLGEGGALFLGYGLGVLAIISGGKIAIALLIMGIPIMDVVWTIFCRLKQGLNPFRFADRQHLHFRLLDLGLSQRQTVLLYFSFAIAFGLAAIFLQSLGKLFALIILLLIMISIVTGFSWLEKKTKKN